MNMRSFFCVGYAHGKLIRKEPEIVPTVLEGGQIAHSALKLLFNMHIIEISTCNLSKNFAMAILLHQCKLIVWHECTMARKKSCQAFDQTMHIY